jgi:hypothetical protein
MGQASGKIGLVGGVSNTTCSALDMMDLEEGRCRDVDVDSGLYGVL